MVRLFALPLAVAAFQAPIHPLQPGRAGGLERPILAAGVPRPRYRRSASLSSITGASTSAFTSASSSFTGTSLLPSRGFSAGYTSLRFPIRHMRFVDAYGPPGSRPADGDISGSFECRKAVPVTMHGGTGRGNWSNHSYGQGRRPESDREPVRRLWCNAKRRDAARVHGSLAITSGDGYTGGGEGVPLDRLGLGRGAGRVARRTTCTSRSPDTDPAAPRPLLRSAACPSQPPG